MAESPALPRTAEDLIQLQIFVDPMFGSERYIKFKPEWVLEAENQLFPLPFWRWRKFPTTVIKFRGGRGEYRVSGYWAEQIQSAQSDTT